MGSEILYDLSPMVRIYKNGRVERLVGTETVDPSFDEKTGVESKDVTIEWGPTPWYHGLLGTKTVDPSFEKKTGVESKDAIIAPVPKPWYPVVSGRLYIPRDAIGSLQKLPVLVYYHGGGFIVETAWSPTYHNYLNALVAEANVVAISVDYRRAPEHPLPVAYEDSLFALEWVASHSAGNGPEEWLNSCANLKKVFLAGDSAGANIINYIGTRLDIKRLNGIEVPGVMMVHPYFWGNHPLPSETCDPKTRSFYEMFWHAANPKTTGYDDPLINPGKDPRISSLYWKKVLVCVAGKDVLRYRGLFYKTILRALGWYGVLEEMESPGEDHVFHLLNPTGENAVKLMKRLVSFMNEDEDK
ncbi:hypothetical protein ACJRO7_027555 [Eucalyptus globulus]|uniref:Alpha/beta hydrolase fold-3 domain-containing protein n=1 Tax=Eucalyptus globulus TaxID=34317 RepID=A0ABD3JSE3_EUCGL